MNSSTNFTSWRETYSRELKDVLGLRGSPVAVAYSDRPASNAIRGRYRACGATPSARDGAVISLSKKNCSCRGGVSHLGLGSAPGKLGELLLCGFLVHGEKLWESLSAAREARNHTNNKAPSPTGLGDHIVFSPLEKAEIEPDLVLFLCNPEQACRLTTLARYRQGVLPPIELEGSFCWSAITYPLVSGNINVSLGDSSARRIENWRPDELVVSVPTPKLHQVMESIADCTAGTAAPLWRLRESPAQYSRTCQEKTGGRLPV